MYLLRRAATQAVSCQPFRTYTSIQARSSRVVLPQFAKPSFARQFHQSWMVRAEEDEKKSPAESESAEETVQVEPSEQEQKEEMVEESIAAPDVTDAAPSSSSSADDAAAAQQQADSARVFDSQPSARPAPGSRHKQPSRILYVGNLFFEVRAEQLQEEFASYGTVTNCKIVADDRGLSRGFGYVEFANQDDAALAVRELDQKVFEGRRMAVQFHERRPRRDPATGEVKSQNPPSKTLFVGNMSYQMSDKDLNDLFREVRDVIDVRVAIDRRSGQPRGFAHADFTDVDAAMKGKELLESKVIYGRQLRIDYSNSTRASRGDP